MTQQGLGRRRSDAWLLRPDAPIWHYQAISALLLTLCIVCSLGVIFLHRPWMLWSHLLSSVFGFGAMATFLTHHIVSRFNACADAYFLGFQAAVEACEHGNDMELIHERVHVQAQAHLRVIGQESDPSVS